MRESISIVGAGSWGIAIAILLSNNGHRVKVWSHNPTEVEMLIKTRVHHLKLPNVVIPEMITFTHNLEEALQDTTVTVLVVPSQSIRQNVRRIKDRIQRSSILVCCSKGIEIETGLLLNQVIEQEIPMARTVVLSGPSHAEEVAQGIPTAVVSASQDEDAAQIIQDVFMSPFFRVYTNADPIGVEVGGALKNVIALCAGISDGLGFGDNTKAALMTRGIIEISRMGQAMGADEKTFGGLTGIGDLIVTCTSSHSRNRRAGFLIGQGKSVNQALAEVKMVVEGYTTAKAAYQLSQKYGVEMPIVEQAYRILYLNENPKQAVYSLMMRDKKQELE